MRKKLSFIRVKGEPVIRMSTPSFSIYIQLRHVCASIQLGLMHSVLKDIMLVYCQLFAYEK